MAFRQTMGRVHRQFAEKGDWFFSTWNADTVHRPQVRQEGALRGCAPRSSSRPIRTAGCCIRARPGTASAISKTATACSTRSRCRSSRPAWPTRAASTSAASRRRLVTAYLHCRGVEVEKTTDFTILFLFSIGITKGKWGTLLNALLDFKRDYDSNAPLARGAAASRRPIIRRSTASSACAISPTGCSRSCASRGRRTGSPRRSRRCPTPVDDAERRVSSTWCATRSSTCRSSDLADRVLATSVVPYPPGIPMLMPGESTGAGRRSVSRLPARAGGVGRALPRLRARHARRRESRRRLLRAVPGKAQRPNARRDARERARSQDVADAGHDARGRQHDRHGRVPAAGQPGAGRRHRDLRLADRDRRASPRSVSCSRSSASSNPQQGGPYAYARDFLGPYAGFQTNYVYWFGNWIGNIAIAVAAVGYLAELIPAITGPPASVIATAVLIWLLTFANILGPRVVGALETWTMALALDPDPRASRCSAGSGSTPATFLAGWNVSGESDMHAVSRAASMALWAYMGIESAAVSAGVIENPKRNVPLATLIGLGARRRRVRAELVRHHGHRCRTRSCARRTRRSPKRRDSRSAPPAPSSSACARC